MRIAVNTRLLIKDKLEGIGWFTFETLKRITQNHPEHDFVFIFDRKYDESFIFSDNVEAVIVPPQARHPLLYYIWFQWSVPYILKKYNIDLLLSPDGYLPLRGKTKAINVIHDLNFEYYPEDLPWIERKNYKFFFPKYARYSNRIATVSEYSKKDISKLYNIPENKIDVVNNGASNIFQPLDEDSQIQIRERFSENCEYFIFVGSLHPRKNLVNLFKAFDLFKKQSSNTTKLLIVGASKWWTDDIKKTFDEMDFQKDVIFSGRVSSEDLSGMIASSIAMTYVSYFEGFGIPIIEAYNCGTAVITSDITSMPEVAGDAAILIDPFNPQMIADAMKKLTDDRDYRNALIEKGNIRKLEYSWDKTAAKLWDCIETVLNQ